MSFWSTRSLESDKNYVVIQHTLKGVNYVINGVKFRDSYAVVEKDSKTYHFLKKVPVLRAAKEYPLTHLTKLPFITRSMDIKAVYGQDVYRRYLAEIDKDKQSQALAKEQEQELLEKLSYQKREEELKLKEQIEQVIEEAKAAGESKEVIEELKKELPVISKCSYRLKDDTLCGQLAFEDSPSKYCHHHIFEEPILSELGIEIPKFMDKKDRKALRKKIEETLTKAKKQGKF
jgi:hypothetical protein